MSDFDLRKKRELKRRKENREYILEVAEKLFVKNGYRKTAMDDIAAEAQFSKATIYRYFEGKLDILIHIVQDSMNEYRDILMDIIKDNISAEKKIKKIIHSILSYFQKKKNLARVFLVERDLMKKFVRVEKGGHFFHNFKKKKVPGDLEALFEDIFNQMCKVIKEGISAGEFRKMDPREAAFLLNSMVRGFHFQGFSKRKDYSIDENAELISDIFINGIKRK
ncbi:MAG: TetR/AcrR family transcriptional regulator [Candidatus Aminicenantes bacterium]|nr:TetR/AcrR family transcriptional regulator [Candidatus Aminicenantes bacterium]